MLAEFAKDIWIADGATVNVMGFRYPTRCVIIRLNQSNLLVWSPIALNDALRAQIDLIGTVTHLIAPNHLHHLFVADWQSVYHTAALHAAPRLAGKRPDLDVQTTLTDTPLPAWAEVLEQVVVQNTLTTEVVFFHKPSQTVIFTDLIQQFPTGWHRVWRAFVARADLMVGDLPNVPRKFRLGFRDRTAARREIGRVLAWPIRRVLLAHGAPITQDGHAVITRAFRWLI